MESCSSLNALLCSFYPPATPEISTLSLHDALPICLRQRLPGGPPRRGAAGGRALLLVGGGRRAGRSEEHTSELQSQSNLVCRLLLEKKKSLHRCLLTAASVLMRLTIADSTALHHLR